MIIIPAIDLKDGKCVRLLKGEFSTVHQVADSATDTACSFLEAGAQLIHMVDLDGALIGEGKNRDVIQKAIENSGARVELGGGIRSMEDIRAAFFLGVWRAVIGSAAVEDPELVRRAAARYRERIAVGIDAKEGRVKTRGWTVDSGQDYIEFAKQMEQLGVQTIIFTDIDCDGALKGPAFERLFALNQAVSCRIVASGGVTTLDDIRQLKQAGVYGAILGKAIYSGALDLKEVIRIGEGE